MKTITRFKIYLPVTAMILAVALAVPAAAQKPVPFEGALRGQDADIGGPDTAFLVETSGTGIGTPVGQFSFTQKFALNFDTGAETGSAHWIAANGDSIFTTIVGQGEPTDTPGVNRIVEIDTITGGTGRFAGAVGGFTVERLITLATGFTSGSFHGTITSPGAAH